MQLISQINSFSEYWNATGSCNDYINDAANLVSGLNIYDIYDLCYDQTIEEPSRLLDPFYRIQQRRRDAKAEKIGSNPPCVDSSVADAWINQDSLRTAVHALPVSQLQWTICSDVLDYTTLYSTVIPIHQQFEFFNFHLKLLHIFIDC
jgi:serine carboxypeptidase-like clade 1